MLPKKILILLLLFLCSATSNSQNRDDACEKFAKRWERINDGFLCNDWIPSEIPKDNLEFLIEREKLQPSPISSFTEQTVTVSSGSSELVSGRKTISIFDEQGNQTEISSYNQDGVLSEQHLYDSRGNTLASFYYDAVGNLRSQEKYRYDEHSNKIESSTYLQDGILDSQSKYEYDALGSLVKTSLFYSSNLRLQTDLIYDSQNNLTETILLDTSNDSKSLTKYKYNESNNLIEEIRCYATCSTSKTFKYDKQNLIEESFYQSDNELISSYKYQYDKQNNLVEEGSYSPKNIRGKYNNYQYDKQNRLIEALYIDPHKDSHLQRSYTYDNQGNIVEFSEYYSNILSSQTKTKYDALGNPVWSSHFKSKFDALGNLDEEASYLPDDNLDSQTQCTYEYDIYSNWTNRICLRYEESNQSIPDSQTITMREINYYD